MVAVKVVNLRTERIRCILCNKNLEYAVKTTHELFICAECQAYFCPDCRKAVINYPKCPAARLLGVTDHELKFIKILPPKPMQITGHVQEQNNTKSVKILPKNKIKILDDDDKKEEK